LESKLQRINELEEVAETEKARETSRRLMEELTIARAQLKASFSEAAEFEIENVLTHLPFPPQTLSQNDIHFFFFVQARLQNGLQSLRNHYHMLRTENLEKSKRLEKAEAEIMKLQAEMKEL
jgi:membrane-bound lytic murein transglycosylase B